MTAPARWPVLVALLAAACGHAPLAPRGVSRVRTADGANPPLAAATLEEVPVCGHSVEVAVVGPEATLSGELLAVSPEALHLVDDAGSYTAIPADRIRRVEVRVLPSHGGEMAAGTVVGTLSTVTHGFLLVMTAPAWIIMGANAAANMAGESSEVAVDRDPNLSAYARFPQGLPPGWPPSGPVRRCTPAPTDDASRRSPAAPAAGKE